MYNEYVESSSFRVEKAWLVVIDCVENIFKELHSARSFVIDDGQYNQGVYLWGFLKLWGIQERYIENEFKNDLVLTGLMVRRIMMNDGERTIKQQLAQLTNHGDKIDASYSKIGSYQKEDVVLQNKEKEISYHVNFPKQK